MSQCLAFPSLELGNRDDERARIQVASTAECFRDERRVLEPGAAEAALEQRGVLHLRLHDRYFLGSSLNMIRWSMYPSV